MPHYVTTTQYRTQRLKKLLTGITYLLLLWPIYQLGLTNRILGASIDKQLVLKEKIVKRNENIQVKITTYIHPGNHLKLQATTHNIQIHIEPDLIPYETPYLADLNIPVLQPPITRYTPLTRLLTTPATAPHTPLTTAIGAPLIQTMYVDIIKIPTKITESSVPQNRFILPPTEISFTADTKVTHCTLRILKGKQRIYSKDLTTPNSTIMPVVTKVTNSINTPYLSLLYRANSRIPSPLSKNQPLINAFSTRFILESPALYPGTAEIQTSKTETQRVPLTPKLLSRLQKVQELARSVKQPTTLHFNIPNGTFDQGGIYTLTLNCNNPTLGGTDPVYTQSLKVYPPWGVKQHYFRNQRLCIEFTRPLDPTASVDIKQYNRYYKIKPATQNTICVSYPQEKRWFYLTIARATSKFGDTLTNHTIRIFNPRGYIYYSRGEEIVLLPAKWYAQQHTLSCEAASIRIALSRYGIYRTELTIMNKVGYSYPRQPQCSDGTQPIPRPNNIWGIPYCPNSELIWGDPYLGFVGSINGKNGVTGWGVQNTAAIKGVKPWAPRSFTFTGLQPSEALAYVRKGYPVIYWEYLPQKITQRLQGATHCWLTPQGKRICWKAGHVKVIVGYSKKLQTNTYTYVQIYDPLYGKLRLSYNDFVSSFNSYGGRGIVVIR